MSLDTKYRPLRYSDVLGQEATIKICKEVVRRGHGFRQSYVFAGGHGGGKCVAGDTLVSTNRGLLPIEKLMGPAEISPIDVQVIGEGGARDRARFSYRAGVRDTFRIESHLGLRLEGTPEHRVRVLSEEGQIEWRRLDQIQEGTWLCVHRSGGVFGLGADTSDFQYDESHKEGTGQFYTIPWETPVTLTPEWGRLIGYLVGDGSCLATTEVLVSNSDPDVKKEVLFLLNKLCGTARETPDLRSRAGLGALRAARKRVRSFLAYAGVGYVGAGDKEIPWSVLRSSVEVCRAFLVGYFEADGHVGPSGVEITSKSEQLIRQVQILLLQFGIVGRVAPKKVYGHGVYWRYDLAGTSRVKFADLVGFSSSRKCAALVAMVQQDHSKFAKEERRITNLCERIPNQQQWVARFYRGLPRGIRDRESNALFRCRNGECELSQRVLERMVEQYLHHCLDEEAVAHFRHLHEMFYAYDPVTRVSEGRCEVFDLNVPQRSMFAAAGLMNHNTTMARILARAILCEDPVDGEPCDTCQSCTAMLADKSENFSEVDAATNSGKDHVKRITEEAMFGSFSGKRKIYLFDECFTEDTMLLTPEGPRSIRDLVEQKYDGLVASMAPNGLNTWRPVTDWYEIPDERECLTLDFDSGAVLTVTTDQEIFTHNRGWVPASGLEEHDGVAGATWHRPKNPVRVRERAALVRKTPVGKKKVYDVTVADTHSFFAYSRHGTHEHAVLAHNCHELSRQAMDALLKPLEDNIRGSQEKQLVALFCTTEPEKMRPAIMSRCAPAFKIRPNTPEEIGQRLAYICEQEEIEYVPEVLPLVAEVVECHVRDAIKAVEGVSMLGCVDEANVTVYLHMDANTLYLDLLEALGFDLPGALTTLEKLNEKVSPATCYERMADICMLAYRLANLGAATVPSYWDRDRLVAVGERHKEFLVEFAQRFATRPYRSTSSMFACDVSFLHQKRAGIVVVAQPSAVVVPSVVQAAPVSAPEAVAPPGGGGGASPAPASLDTFLTGAPASPSEKGSGEISPAPIEPSPKEKTPSVPSAEKQSASVGSIRTGPFVNEMGVYVNPQAQNVGRGLGSRSVAQKGTLSALSPAAFVEILKRRVIELTEEQSTSGRSARRDDMGSS